MFHNELATEESRWVGKDTSVCLVSGSILQSAIFVLAISPPEGLIRETTSGTSKRCHHLCKMGSFMEDRQDYGRRLLPHIVDAVASETPDRIVYSIVHNPDDARDIKHITASHQQSATI